MITPNDVFLVSGGAKGITAYCVTHLAQTYKCKFILMGRSQLAESEPAWAHGVADADLKKTYMQYLVSQGQKPLPKDVQKGESAVLAHREIVNTLQAIRQAGGQAEYMSADARNEAAVKQAVTQISQKLGRVTGIIHGAGVLADKFIKDKTAADFDSVYGVKVDGLKNMLSAVPPQELKWLVLFSSAAGFFGNPGQSDYALANEILNKVAHVVKQQYPNCKAVSIGWGPWDGGMVTPQLKKLFAERGVDIIPLDEGAELLARELHPALHQTTQIVVGGELAPAEIPLDPALRTHHIQRVLSEVANPFVKHHTIGEHAVIPATGVMGWIANSCEQLYPGLTFAKAEQFKTLKGLVFDDSLAASYQLELKETHKTDHSVTFEAMLSSINPQNRPRYHYSGRFTIQRQLPPAPMVSVTKPAGGGQNKPIYQDGTLFHGPLFAGIQKIWRCDQQGIVVECVSPHLTDQEQGQFPVQSFNSYAADVQFQAAAVWTRFAYQSAMLPAKVELAEQFAPIPFDTPYLIVLDVLSSTPTGAVINTTVCSPAGQVYLCFTPVEVTISPALNPLFEQGARVHYQLVR